MPFFRRNQDHPVRSRNYRRIAEAFKLGHLPDGFAYRMGNQVQSNEYQEIERSY